MANLSIEPNRFYPNLPEIGRDSQSHTVALLAIKEALHTHERRDRNYLKSFVRFEELVDLGLIDVQGNQIEGAVGGGGSSTLAGLDDTDLTGQGSGDLLYNNDGVEWRDTNGALVFDPVGDFLQLGENHSINWLDANLLTNEMLKLSIVNVETGLPDVDTLAYEAISPDILNTNTFGFTMQPDGLRADLGRLTANDTDTMELLVAWDITSLQAFNSGAGSFGSGSDYYPTGIAWNNDGTKLYVSQFSRRRIAEHLVPTPFTISTIVDPTTPNFEYEITVDGAQNAMGFRFNSDGTRLLALTEPGNLYSYTLSTAFDLSTISQTSTILLTNPLLVTDLVVDGTGTRIWVLSRGSGINVLHQYTLGTAWEASSATEDGITYDLDTAPAPIYLNSTSMFVEPTQGKLYVLQYTSDTARRILQYTFTPEMSGGGEFTVGNPLFETKVLGSAISFYDEYTFPTTDGAAGQSLVSDGAGQLSFASVGDAIDESDLVHITGQETILGTKQFNNYILMNSPLIMLDSNPIQWDHPTDTTTFLNIENVPATLDAWGDVDQFTALESSSEFQVIGTNSFAFNDTGLYGYVSGDSGLHRGGPYATAWDPDDALSPTTIISTTDNFHGMGWASDGTKVFIFNETNGTIEERANAGTPFIPGAGDLNTVNDTFPEHLGNYKGLHVTADGSRIYTGNQTDLFEINLSTPDDLTTASVGTSFDVATAVGGGYLFDDVSVSPDGLTVYVVGRSNNTIHQIDLTVPWDLSTASFNGTTKVVGGPSGAGFAKGLDVKPDGSVMVTQHHWGNNPNNNDTGRHTSNASTPGSPATTGFFVGDPDYPTEIDGTFVGLKNNIGINWDNILGTNVELAIFQPNQVGVVTTGTTLVQLDFDDGIGTNAGAADDVVAVGDGVSGQTAEINATSPAYSDPFCGRTTASTGTAYLECEDGPTSFDWENSPATFECRWYHTGGFAKRIVEFLDAADVARQVDSIQRDQTTGFLQVVINNVLRITGDINVTDSAFHHIALSKDSNDVFRLYLNGVFQGEYDASGDTWASVPEKMWFCRFSASGTENRIDNIRFVTGEALYTEAFAPPTTIGGEGEDVFILGDPSYATFIDGSSVKIDAPTNITGATAMGDTLDVVGATALGDTLDVTGATDLGDTLDVAGTASILGRLSAEEKPASADAAFQQFNGNDAGLFDRVQQSMAWNNLNITSYRHSIRTRHQGGSIAGNAIDFFLWTSADAIETMGSLRALSIDASVIQALVPLSIGGRFDANTTTVTTTSHTAADEHVILVDDDTAGSAVTITLPAAATASTIYHVKKLGTTANVVVDGDGTETIDGALTATLTLQYESIMIVSDGSNWHVL